MDGRGIIYQIIDPGAGVLVHCNSSCENIFITYLSLRYIPELYQLSGPHLAGLP